MNHVQLHGLTVSYVKLNVFVFTISGHTKGEKRRLEESSHTVESRKKPAKKKRQTLCKTKKVQNLLVLLTSLRPFEMVWARIREYVNWPGIIERQTEDGKFLIHFFGDYSVAKVPQTKIMHLMEGFIIYSKASKPSLLLIKAIKEGQMFILDTPRVECPIYKMLEIKASLR